MIVHGYSTYVNHGCRCEVCRAGCRDYYRARRASKPARSAPSMGWQDRAECRGWDPEVFFVEKLRGLALHVCRQHCPVVRDCLLWSRRVRTTHAVQGGVVWSETGRQSRLGHVPDRRCVRCP